MMFVGRPSCADGCCRARLKGRWEREKPVGGPGPRAGGRKNEEADAAVGSWWGHGWVWAGRWSPENKLQAPGSAPGGGR